MTDDQLQAALEVARQCLPAQEGVLRVELIGSASYLPANEGADLDYAVLVAASCDPAHFALGLSSVGFLSCSQYDKEIGEDKHWCAVRRDALNLMITNDAQWFELYLRAMRVCGFLGLRAKSDRIAVCRIVRDGKPLDEVRKFLAENVL